MSLHNLPDIQTTLKLLYNPGDVVESRVLHTPRSGTVSGYFDDMDKLANAAVEWSGQAPGVYVTINPVLPALLARSNNRLQTWVKHTTSDTEIVKRQWLPLDFDPIRPSGISSTDIEHDQALLAAIECAKFLRELGFSEDSIIVADSGNGGHVLVRIDLPNDSESTQLIKRCLEAVGFLFSDGKVSGDLTVFNPGRIWKLYGTMACKGDQTEDRPHRLARLLSIPEKIIPVPIELLKKLAAMAPEQPKSSTDKAGGGRSFDLARWLEANQLDVNGPSPWNNGRKWILPICPWNPDHNDRAAYILEFPNGAIAAGCHHNGCLGKGWHDLRDVVEPGWRKGSANLEQDFTSDYTDGSSEAKLNRKVNAGELQRTAESPELNFEYLPLLGIVGYIVKGLSHLIASIPRLGKTELLVRLIAEWLEERVLYFTEEPVLIWRERLRQLPQTYDHVNLINALGMNFSEIIQEIEQAEETVIIIDTVRNLLGVQDENDNSEVARMMNPLVSAARRSKKTLILVHHSRKSGGEHGKSIAGAHSLLGTVDIALEVQLDRDEDAPRRIIRGWARVIQIPKLVYELKPDGTMIALGSPAQVSLAGVMDKVYELLDEDWQLTKQIREQFPDPKPSVDQVTKALEQLANEGLAERDPPISMGKKRGKTYKWRRLDNLTSDEPFPRSEVKSETVEEARYH